MQLSIELCYQITARVLYTGSATGLTSQIGSSTLRNKNTSLYKDEAKKINNSTGSFPSGELDS